LSVERGELSIETRVCDLLPTYRGDGKEEMRMRHLLTPTAAFPELTLNRGRRTCPQSPRLRTSDGSAVQP